MLITFEGGEGAGKTTLIQQVAAYFATLGRDVVETREPGGTALGSQVRHLLLKVNPEMMICHKAELMLYMTSRAETVAEIISPALQAGKVVLCDRFNDSTIVYQGAARGLDVNEVRRLCEFVCGAVKPDLTFYLDVDPEVGLLRTKKTSKEQSEIGEMDRIESEGLAFHRQVRDAYLHIAQAEPERVVVLDANQTIDHVCNQAMMVLKQCLNS